jgi:hypothetical protein
VRTKLLGLMVAATCLISARMDAQTNAIVRPSVDIKDTVVRFYQRMRASDMAGFDEFISTDPSLLVIGSANEWYTERERLRGVFRLRNQGLEGGADLIAYENGDMGWFIDRPDWIFSDGSRMHTRFTAILHREGSGWKFVHWHLSVGVPDEDAVALQRRLPAR